ncbi:hypothetical protein BDZ89DRAFT_1151998 [Hymenopellis radicata]|nr:hypothetical protein BDZ89DRAFT_1151998 [Hymenopellis radicata]
MSAKNRTGGMNADWQSWVSETPSTTKTSSKNKGKTASGKKPRVNNAKSSVDTGEIVFKDVGVDAAAQGKVKKPRKFTNSLTVYKLTDLPFDNGPVDLSNFKNKFLPAIYAHREFKPTIEKVWCDVFKYLDKKGNRRIDNEAILPNLLRTFRSAAAAVSDNPTRSVSLRPALRM